MSYFCSMRSEVYDIEFYLMTQHVNGIQSPEEYIEDLVTSLYKELIIDRRFDKKNAIKLLNLTIEKVEERCRA